MLHCTWNPRRILSFKYQVRQNGVWRSSWMGRFCHNILREHMIYCHIYTNDTNIYIYSYQIYMRDKWMVYIYLSRNTKILSGSHNDYTWIPRDMGAIRSAEIIWFPITYSEISFSCSFSSCRFNKGHMRFWWNHHLISVNFPREFVSFKPPTIAIRFYYLFGLKS